MASTFSASCTRRTHGGSLSSSDPQAQSTWRDPESPTSLFEEQYLGLVVHVSHLEPRKACGTASGLQVWNIPPVWAGFDGGGAMGEGLRVTAVTCSPANRAARRPQLLRGALRGDRVLGRYRVRGGKARIVRFRKWALWVGMLAPQRCADEGVGRAEDCGEEEQERAYPSILRVLPPQGT